MYIGLHIKYPLFLSYFNGTWLFTTDFSKNTQDIKLDMSNVCPVLYHADRQTEVRRDMTELIVSCHNFANTPEMKTIHSLIL